MKLNRTQALFLVGTIAAVGCVVDNSDDGGSDDNQGGAGGSGGSSAATGGSNAGSSGSSGSSGNHTGGTNPGGAGGEGGATCSDDTGPQVLCAEFMEPGAGGVGAGGDGYGGAGGVGPSCEGMAALQTLFCESLWDNFKPGVANAARACLNAQSPDDLCTWGVSFGCASEAILAACPDDSADDECEAIMAGCPDLTAGDCASVLGAMTQAGRDMVVSCAAESLECNPWVCAGVASPAVE